VSTFKTQIVLGERYRDKATGFEGTCGAVFFYEHGCERVQLKGMNHTGEVVEYVFDAPELESVRTDRRVQVLAAKTGGPHGRTPPSR
jgi:hypothetical protein